MIAYDAEPYGGSYVVRTAPDRQALITRDGEPATFLPGWVPTTVLCDPGSVSILELQHAAGDRAIWYLDTEFRFVGNALTSLSDATKRTLLDAARVPMRAAW